MKKEVKETLDNWFRNTKYEILHYWKGDYDTHYIVAQGPVDLDFIRIFRLGDGFALSADKSIYNPVNKG
jgi:hypothetical protein